MSVERRLRETLAAFDAVEPAPDLFQRVERSVAEDLVRRRRIGRWVAGAIGGVVIGLVTEYYTGGEPVRRIAKSGETGTATVMITGLAIGMQSVVVPILTICTIIFVSNALVGLYGVVSLARLWWVTLLTTPDHDDCSSGTEGTHARTGGPSGDLKMLGDFRRRCTIRLRAYEIQYVPVGL